MGVPGVGGVSRAAARLGMNTVDDKHGVGVLKAMEWNAFPF